MEEGNAERGTSRMPGLPAALRHLGTHMPTTLLQQARPPDLFGAIASEFQGRTARLHQTLRTQMSQQDAAEEGNGNGLHISIELGESDRSQADSSFNSTGEGDDSMGSPSPETVALITMVQRYLPFALILAVKSLFDHGIGLLVCAALLVTFSHANSRLKREVALQARRSLGALCFLVAHVAACVTLLYTVFEDQRFYTNLWLSPPLSAPLTLPELLWLVTVTDFVLKLITIGSVFLAVEASSQLYRALAPLQPWLYYLIQAYHGAYKLVGVCLSAAYLVCKCRELIARVKAWREASSQLFAHSSLGQAPTAAQMVSAGPMCTICHEAFTTPVCLPCSHVFCEACLATWADREPSCPLCRARFGSDPAWRDGATSFFMQLF
ncbi:hypothetical protein B566_EDAN007220 [Ephemera danica]|nr:hypothetical protein B566_EDAN007220 [Ephemera danica]